MHEHDSTPVYIAAKTHPWDLDAVTTDPTRADHNHPKSIGETAPVPEDDGAFITVPPGKMLVGGHLVTPSRWLPPLRIVRAEQMNPEYQADILRMLAEMSRCVLPPSATFEIIEPASPPRTMLARTAFLGLFARDAVHDRMRWHERDERGNLRVVP